MVSNPMPGPLKSVALISQPSNGTRVPPSSWIAEKAGAQIFVPALPGSNKNKNKRVFPSTPAKNGPLDAPLAGFSIRIPECATWF